jgi:membrane fusion protein (multidrug efflux system)
MDTVIAERVTADIQLTRRPMLGRKQLCLCAAVILALSATWYGQRWWTTGRFIETTDDAYVGANVTPLAPHVDAFIEQILVADNQFVHAGQTLIRLDPRDYQVALDHAAAVLEARQAAAEGLRAQRVLQQSTIRQQQADIAAKTARAAFAEADASRYGVLAQSNYGSRQDAQRALSLRQESRAAVTSAEAGLGAARQQLTVLSAEISEADATVAEARSDLHMAQLNLGYTEIRSPIDGYVGNRAAQVGAYANRGTYLVSVTPGTGLWVDANFKEDQLTRMVPGQSANITADVLPGHVFHGHVVSLTPATGAVFSVIPPENATGNFTKIVQRVPVRVVLDPGDAELAMLRPGLSITVGVDTREEGRVP